MYTGRTLEGNTLEDMLNPAFRTVNFDDEHAMVLVSLHLRLAWTAIPSGDTTYDAIGSFIKASHDRTEDERSQLQRNPDKNVHTPWRDAIYHFWNHVFNDVMGFLSNVGPGIGHYHSPSHNTFALAYPGPQREDGATILAKKWENNVLMIPAYLESGVSIRMSMASIGDNQMSEKTLGNFDSSKSNDIWFLKGGNEVVFHVEGDYERDREGIAAVLVYANLCTKESRAAEKNKEVDCYEIDGTNVNGMAAESSVGDEYDTV